MATANHTEYPQSATPRALVLMAEGGECLPLEPATLAQLDALNTGDGLLSEHDTSRLTTAIQRSTRQDVQDYRARMGFSEIEACALVLAHAALHVQEGGYVDAWSDQVVSLIGRAQTEREKALVAYADVVMECAWVDA